MLFLSFLVLMHSCVHIESVGYICTLETSSSYFYQVFNNIVQSHHNGDHLNVCLNKIPVLHNTFS